MFSVMLSAGMASTAMIATATSRDRTGCRLIIAAHRSAGCGTDFPY
jgi:hypothetical protein